MTRALATLLRPTCTSAVLVYIGELMKTLGREGVAPIPVKLASDGQRIHPGKCYCPSSPIGT